MDFRNRLIAKFEIPRARSFWNAGFEATPKTALYPPNDRVESLCRDVVTRTRQAGAAASGMGRLLVEWAEFEERLLPDARRLTGRNVSVREAIAALVRDGQISKDAAAALDEAYRVRNTAAHTPSSVAQADIDRALHRLHDLSKRILRDRNQTRELPALLSRS